MVSNQEMHDDGCRLCTAVVFGHCSCPHCDGRHVNHRPATDRPLCGNHHTNRCMKCYNELYLVEISGLWVHMALSNTTLHFSYIGAHCSGHTAELIHKSATVTPNNAHIARAIVTRCRVIKRKKKRKIPPSAQSAYIKK